MTNPIVFVLAFVFSAFYSIVQFFVGYFLLRRYFGTQTKFRNLIPLIIYFFVSGITVLLNVFFRAVFMTLGFSISFFALIFFTKMTFYEERRPIVHNLMLTVGFLLVIITNAIKLYRDTIADSFTLFKVNMELLASLIFLSTLWLAYASFSSYFRISKRSLEPWVKQRYMLNGVGNVILALSGAFLLFHNQTGFATIENSVIMLSILFVQVVSSVLSYLCWYMPDSFKSYLNRDFQPQHNGHLSEKEMMKRLKEGPDY